MLHTGKTRYFAFVTLGAGVVNVGANLVLIPVNGIVGSAQATVIGWLVWKHSLLAVSLGETFKGQPLLGEADNRLKSGRIHSVFGSW